ncbi:hypothetical protein [Lachnoclostridium phytofermentans]|uniref:hypothetical protein n=1 Tax=Lachnoclostridium phytofermentans TaxID=66219 RepID=UPI00055061A2|nr:hypothetical protein [Lachnoclostridium phytofermentans]
MKDLNSIATEMMEHICDNICRFPREVKEEELEFICAECKMGKFVCDIINPGKSNLESLTVDALAMMMYENDDIDKACKGLYNDSDELVCPDGQSGEKQECIECIKKWLREEAVE